MSSNKSPAWGLWLAVLATFVFFTNLGGPFLFDEDEPKNAECGREMFVRGDWIVPTFNEDLRTDKPILIYWQMLLAFHLMGVSEFSARFWSALLSVGTTLLTYRIGCRLFSPRVGFLGGLALCTSLMYAAVGRSVTPDATLIFWTTATFALFVEMVSRAQTQSGAGVTSSIWSDTLPPDSRTDLFNLRKVPGGFLIFVSMGFAVLAKGPVGIILPCGILGLFLLCQQPMTALPPTDIVGWSWRAILKRVVVLLHGLYRFFAWNRVWKAISQLGFWPGIGLTLAIALPWYVAVGYATEGAWLQGFLGGHNVSRFLKPMENHRGPIIYYLPVLLMGCFPWSLWFPPAIWRLTTQARRPAGLPAGLCLLACWVGVWVTFFSLASTKLPNYVLPVYPALALLSAWWIEYWFTSSDPFADWLYGIGCRFLIGVGVLGTLVLGIVLYQLAAAEVVVAAVFLVPTVAGVYSLAFAQEGQKRQALTIFGASAFTMATLMMSVVGYRVSLRQDGPRFAEQMRKIAGNEPLRVATFEYSSPNLVYYLKQRVDGPRDPQSVGEFFVTSHGHPTSRALLMTRADRLPALTPHLPEGVEILARDRRFLRHHDLVVLGFRSQPAVAERLLETEVK